MNDNAERMLKEVLVDLLGRAMAMARASTKLKGKNRAIAVATHIELMRAYNTALKYSERAGLMQGKELKVELTKLMRNNGYTALDEDEFDELIHASYGTTTFEMIARRHYLEQNKNKIQIVTKEMTGAVAQALILLVQHEVLGPMLIPVLDTLVDKGIVLERVNDKPRGDPRKAGLISSYKRKGYSEERAYSEAERAIEAHNSINKNHNQEKRPTNFPATPDLTSISATAGVSEEEMQAAIDLVTPKETVCGDKMDTKIRQMFEIPTGQPMILLNPIEEETKSEAESTELDRRTTSVDSDPS